MGNQIPPGIPPMLSKNWQPVPDHPNSFRNKLTFQYTHKHIINVENSYQIQSFKQRMKQTNPYICRVLFYHQYHESIYHVYTDEIHLQPNVARVEQWKVQKIKILEGFYELTQNYGYFKVCKQMIGADSNLHPKIWIHPDPIAYKPWAPCNSQYVMLSDILAVIKGLEEKFSQAKSRKQINKSILTRTHTEYTSFKQYIQAQKNKLDAEQLLGKGKLNYTSTFIDTHAHKPQHSPNTTNLNININIQLDRQERTNRNKTYAIGHSKTNTYTNRQTNYTINTNAVTNVNNYTNTNYGIKENKHKQMNHSYNGQQIYPEPGMKQSKQPRYSNATENCQGNLAKNSKLEKLFKINTIETAREDVARSKNMTSPQPQWNRANQSKKKDLSLERPITYYQLSPKYQTRNILSDPHERNDHSFKYGEQIQVQNTTRDKSMSRLKKINKQSETCFQPKDFNKQTKREKYKRNPLLKLITCTSQVRSQSPININRNKIQNKSTKGLHHSRGLDNSLTIQNGFKSSYINRKEHKFTNIPNFLMKSHTELGKELMKNKIIAKHPSTQRQNREAYEEKPKQETTLLKEQPKPDPPKQQQENEEQTERKMRPRKNTVAILKQQFSNILQSVIQPQEKPVSSEYQSFKATKIEYKPQNFFEAYISDSEQQDKDEIDLIKEKVQQKRVRFAQLKLDAKKILQDSL